MSLPTSVHAYVRRSGLPSAFQSTMLYASSLVDVPGEQSWSEETSSRLNVWPKTPQPSLELGRRPFFQRAVGRATTSSLEKAPLEVPRRTSSPQTTSMSSGLGVAGSSIRVGLTRSRRPSPSKSMRDDLVAAPAAVYVPC